VTRQGASSRQGEEVAERRLLEVGGMGHGIENVLPQIKIKLTEFFRLPFPPPMFEE
jgi:hypothetical protein